MQKAKFLESFFLSVYLKFYVIEIKKLLISWILDVRETFYMLVNFT